MSIEHIFIVTATMDKMVSSGVTNLFSAVHAQNATAKKYKFSTLVIEDVQGHAMMRNVAAGKFLESKCDRLWFIDNDVMPANNMLSFLDVEGDIVAAVVPFVYCTSGVFMRINDLDDLSTIDKKYYSTGTLEDATCVGTGCTWIRREVLENPGMYYSRDFVRPDGKKDRLDDNEAPCIFRYHHLPHGGTMMGEDFDLSYRASKLGYRVRLDGRVICEHVKTVALLVVIERGKEQWEEAQASLSVA